MIKQVFLVVGFAKTGKTILGDLLNKRNTIVFDNIPKLKGRENLEGIRRRLDIETLGNVGYEYIVYITNLYENVDYITRKFLPNTPVSVCKFEQAFIKGASNNV